MMPVVKTQVEQKFKLISKEAEEPPTPGRRRKEGAIKFPLFVYLSFVFKRRGLNRDRDIC
jgi:hypothetical protein